MTFTSDEYERIRDGAKASAAAVVPAVYNLLKPETIVDVGGGEGWWAREFALQGCSAVVLDEAGETTPPGEKIEVWPGEVTYYKAKLGSTEPAPAIPFPPVGYYDLAICLEVAEHLDAADAAGLVHFLCQIAPIVLFSAAIPGQGGHGHVNEQWPAYWVKLFDEHDRSGTDFLRWRFWDDQGVEPWYRQNMLLFAKVETLSELLQKVEWHLHPKAVVHPEIFGWRIAERDKALAITDGFTWTGP